MLVTIIANANEKIGHLQSAKLGSSCFGCAVLALIFNCLKDMACSNRFSILDITVDLLCGLI